MINFTSRTKYFLKSTPTDMRKGYEGLASIVREVMGHNPRNYNEAFVFYSKDYRKVKILHYDINGWVLYQKWFTDGKFLKPEFEQCKVTHANARAAASKRRTLELEIQSLKIELEIRKLLATPNFPVPLHT